MGEVRKVEEIIYNLLEKSLVGGAFLFLLYHLVTRVTSTLQDISKNLVTVSMNMTSIAESLIRIDRELSDVKERISELERK